MSRVLRATFTTAPAIVRYIDNFSSDSFTVQSDSPTPRNTKTPGAVKFWGPYLYRSPFHATTPQEECERAAVIIEEVL